MEPPKHPSLPANYLSFAQLQQQWLQKQNRKTQHQQSETNLAKIHYQKQDDDVVVVSDERETEDLKQSGTNLVEISQKTRNGENCKRSDTNVAKIGPVYRRKQDDTVVVSGELKKADLKQPGTNLVKISQKSRYEENCKRSDTNVAKIGPVYQRKQDDAVVVCDEQKRDDLKEFKKKKKKKKKYGKNSDENQKLGGVSEDCNEKLEEGTGDEIKRNGEDRRMNQKVVECNFAEGSRSFDRRTQGKHGCVNEKLGGVTENRNEKLGEGTGTEIKRNGEDQMINQKVTNTNGEASGVECNFAELSLKVAKIAPVYRRKLDNAAVVPDELKKDDLKKFKKKKKYRKNSDENQILGGVTEDCNEKFEEGTETEIKRISEDLRMNQKVIECNFVELSLNGIRKGSGRFDRHTQGKHRHVNQKLGGVIEDGNEKLEEGTETEIKSNGEDLRMNLEVSVGNTSGVECNFRDLSVNGIRRDYRRFDRYAHGKHEDVNLVWVKKEESTENPITITGTKTSGSRPCYSDVKEKGRVDRFPPLVNRRRIYVPKTDLEFDGQQSKYGEKNQGTGLVVKTRVYKKKNQGQWKEK